MLIRRSSDIRSSEITDERLYAGRRQFIKTALALSLGSLAGTASSAQAAPAPVQGAPGGSKRSPFSTDEPPTGLEYVTGYNNFYEFGFDKDDPARYAGRLTTKPWTVKVEGQMHAREGDYHLEDLIKPYLLEERIYRLRCVEGWSMVVPWLGFPLRDLIGRFEPTAKATFVEFQTLYRPAEMPGQSQPLQDLPSDRESRNSHSVFDAAQTEELEWPYVEALRLDEAMHPLTILAVGLYGKTLPNQNGAPLRLVIPWKYGFKSIKSIVRIRFTDRRPQTTWNIASPQAFGFYANVNPDVPRPQSQKTERRLGNFFRQPTLLFNGYAEQVGQLYASTDLKANF